MRCVGNAGVHHYFHARWGRFGRFLDFSGVFSFFFHFFSLALPFFHFPQFFNSFLASVPFPGFGAVLGDFVVALDGGGLRLLRFSKVASYFLSGYTLNFFWLVFPLKMTKTKKFKLFLLGKLTK